MSEEAKNKEGPSKNELKKLAKKAEKAAKKQQAKQQQAAGGASPSSKKPKADAPPVATPDVATASVQQPSPVLLANASKDSVATLKVVWASLYYKVNLEAAKRKDLPTDSADVWLHHHHEKHQHPLLIFKDQVVSGGGNAMVQTIAYLSSTDSSIPQLQQILIDEWCEWERTVLRKAGTVQQQEAALDHLSKSLQDTPTGVHLLGSQDSVADICIVSTLSKILNQHHSTDHIAKKHPTIHAYMQAHANILNQVHDKIDQLVQASSSSSSHVDMNEPSLNKVVASIFAETVHDLFGDSVELPNNMVTKCTNPKHGDYQCNAAMPTFANLKKSGFLPADMRSPQDVAAAMIANLGPDHPVLVELQCQGPGFVLCRLRPSFLQHHVNQLVQTGKLPIPHDIVKQTCVVDFSSPNIAKEMHVGHLRSTIIGEAVCRILEFVGHDVHRVNHVGDWGTQFGMLIQYLKEEYPDVGNENAELPNITDLTLFYKNAKARFDEDADFKKTSQTNVVKLQSGDAECLRIWKLLCDVSRHEFEKVYNRLDVACEEFGESFYNDKIPAVIEEFTQAGKISIEEGGAKCVFVESFKIPLMLQKSDGGYGYDSTDMAALKYRLQTLKANRIIVITDFSQGDHFKMVYAAGRDIGWLDQEQRLQHIGFGTVMGEDGKRFKTRSGDTVRLVDLLDEAVSRMEAQLKTRIDEGKANITVDELHTVAEAIGYGAVKYYDLRRNPTSNYKFSYDQMLDTKGDTAVYLLYARVRLESIAAKAKAEHGVDVHELVKSGEKIEITHPSERNLAMHLLLFPDTLVQTLDDLFPYHICEYVYKLSIAASDFVTQCRVLGSPEMKSRLLFCYATTEAMHQCFDLLGIRHVKRI